MWHREVEAQTDDEQVKLSLEELPEEVRFRVWVLDPPPGQLVSGVRLDPGDGVGVPMSVTLTYVVMERSRQRGNVWVKLKVRPRVLSPWRVNDAAFR